MLQRAIPPVPRSVATGVVLALLLSVLTVAPRPATAQTEPPVAQNIIEIQTRRDAGSVALPGFESLTPESFTATPLVLLQETTTALSEGGIAVETVDVEAGTARLLAELTASPADVDLSVRREVDGAAEEEVCPGVVPRSGNACDLVDPAPGRYAVRVESTFASAPGATDQVTFGTAVVPGDGPSALSVAVLGDPAETRLLYDEPALEAGQSWHAAVRVGGSTIGVDLDRLADDLTKTASTTTPQRGETFTYTLEVRPNVTPEDLSYTITDPIPEGLTYVAGSATGGATFQDGTVTWSPVATTPVGPSGYALTTNAESPDCLIPGSGRYRDLAEEAVPILATPGVEGNGEAFTTFNAEGDAPFEFYEDEYDAVSFTDDGYLVFNIAENDPSPSPAAQRLPGPTTPNAIAAPLWADWELVYDPAENRGVTLATLGGTGPDSSYIVDYGAVQRPGAADGAPTYDFQVHLYRSVSDAPGDYEIYYAYNDLGPLDGRVTVGVEDPAGENASTLLNAERAEGAIADDLVVCLDYLGPPPEAQTVTYQVTVDRDTPLGALANVAEHTTDDPATPATETATAVVIVREDISDPTVELDPVATVAGRTAPTRPHSTAQISGTRSERASVVLEIEDGAGRPVADRLLPIDDGTFDARSTSAVSLTGHSP